MIFQKNNLYRIVDNHKFWPARVGKFEFMGGPKRDVVVLSDPYKKEKVMFAVAPEDVATQVENKNGTNFQ